MASNLGCSDLIEIICSIKSLSCSLWESVISKIFISGVVCPPPTKYSNQPSQSVGGETEASNNPLSLINLARAVSLPSKARWIILCRGSLFTATNPTINIKPCTPTRCTRLTNAPAAPKTLAPHQPRKVEQTRAKPGSEINKTIPITKAITPNPTAYTRLV